MGAASRAASTTAVVATMLAAAAAVPAPAGAQAGGDLAARVERVEGTARFSFPVREGVEVCDQGIRRGRNEVMWRSRGWDDAPSNCRWGPVEVEVEVRGGRVSDVDIPTRRSERAVDATELGEVPAETAVAYLSGVARGSGSDRAARDAVFPMVLADVPEVWRELMALARERDGVREARKNALFWLGQEAADAATGALSDVARAEDEDQEVRDAAVFALSQRPEDEGVPILMEVARTARHAKTRRSAMFWLAQSDDPRVVAFFEEILLGRSGR